MEPVIIPALAGAAPDAPETLKSTNIADTIMVGARVRTHHPGAAASRRGVARRERQRRAPAVGEVDGGDRSRCRARSSTGRSWSLSREAGRDARGRAGVRLAHLSSPGNTAEATFVTMHQRARTRPVLARPARRLADERRRHEHRPAVPARHLRSRRHDVEHDLRGRLVGPHLPDRRMPRARRPPGRGRRAARLPRRGQGVAR